MGEDLIYTQRVELRIVDQDTQAERTKTDRQSWRYDAAAKRWWLTSGLPKLDCRAESASKRVNISL